MVQLLIYLNFSFMLGNWVSLCNFEVGLRYWVKEVMTATQPLLVGLIGLPHFLRIFKSFLKNCLTFPFVNLFELAQLSIGSLVVCSLM